MDAAVDTTAAAPQFLAGLSPASGPPPPPPLLLLFVAAAGAALLCMFIKCAVFVVLIYVVHGLFTTLMFPILSPICFFAC